MIVGRDIPDVIECLGWADTESARKLHPDYVCSQCNGGHSHIWVKCEVPPHMVRATRCQICGARKCDVPNCTGRRHHRDAHVLTTGDIYQVGT